MNTILVIIAVIQLVLMVLVLLGLRGTLSRAVVAEVEVVRLSALYNSTFLKDEEDEPCLLCGGSGYITVGEVVIDGALEQEFEDCSPECVKQQQEESAAWSRMIYARALTRWSCVHCQELAGDCKCTDTDIPF